MTFGNGQGNIEAYNRTAIASNPQYVQTNLGIKPTDEETQNLNSNTFGQIKRDPDAKWFAIGLSPNVNRAIETLMSDPNSAIQVGDKIYRPQTAVGNLRPYNEAGNPSGGCSSFNTFG